MERTNDLLLQAFAEVLRTTRLAAGLSQEELAARADISTRFISFLETRRRQPTLTALHALSRGLGQDFGAFSEAVDRRYQELRRGNSV